MIRKKKDWLDAGDIVVLNYDILTRDMAQITARQWGMLIADECHYLRGYKSARSKNVRKLAPSIPYRIMVTGTPCLNRPVELWPILNVIDPKEWESLYRYAVRYCNMIKTRWGMDMSGSSNEAELSYILRSRYMIRRLKADVMPQLPKKTRQIIEIPHEHAAEVKHEIEMWDSEEEKLNNLRLVAELAKASENEEDYREAIANLKTGMSVAFSEIALMRKKIAEIKLPICVDFIMDTLEDGEESLVAFSWHKVLSSGIHSAMSSKGISSVLIDGDVPVNIRQERIDQFQQGKARVFSGTIGSCGVGNTLTRSHHVIFTEADWTPANLSQAEDRLARIGQTENVLVQHLVLEGSLDSRMLKRVVEKQEILDAILDNPCYAVDTSITSIPAAPAASQSSSRQMIADLAVKMTDNLRRVVLAGLRQIAGMCDGARAVDGKGFNKVDTMIGKSLSGCQELTPKQAALGYRILSKYKQQLSGELLEQLKGVEE